MRTAIKNLNRGDRFIVTGGSTVYVAQQVTTLDNYTRVVYRVEGDSSQHEMVKVCLASVDILP